MLNLEKILRFQNAHAVAQVYTSVGVDITIKENMDANTELFAKEIQDRFKGLGKKYVAKVRTYSKVVILLLKV